MSYLLTGVICECGCLVEDYILTKIFDAKAKKKGYVREKNRIIGLNNILTSIVLWPVAAFSILLYAGLVVYFCSSDERLEKQLSHNKYYTKAEHPEGAKFINYKKREDVVDSVVNDTKVSSDSKEVTKSYQKDGSIELRNHSARINAMMGAEQWSDDIKLTAGLPGSKSDKLYSQPVSDYSSDEGKGRAIQKTMKPLNRNGS